MRRVLFVLALTAVVVVVLGSAGYGVAWLLAARSAEAMVGNWADARRSSGFEVVVGNISVSGFPTEIVLEIERLQLTQAEGTLPWRWQAERIRGEGRLGDRGVTIRVVGAQDFTFGAPGSESTLRATARRFAVDLTLGEDRIESVYADIRGLSVDREERDPLTARRIQIRAAPGDGPGLVPDDTRVALSLDTVVLPEHRRGPLGDTIEALRAEVRVRGVLRSLDLPEALANWRSGGGVIALLETQVRWGTLDMQSAGGMFRLDEQFRPTGGFDAQVSGYLVTIDAFHAAGLLSQEVLDDIRSLLAFLRDQGRGVGGGTIGLPVRIQNGLVSVGKAQLGTVPPLIPAIE